MHDETDKMPCLGKSAWQDPLSPGLRDWHMFLSDIRSNIAMLFFIRSAVVELLCLPEPCVVAIVVE